MTSQIITKTMKKYAALAIAVVILATAGAVTARPFNAPGQPNPPIYTADGVNAGGGAQTIDTAFGVIEEPLGAGFKFRVAEWSRLASVRTIPDQSSERYAISSNGNFLQNGKSFIVSSSQTLFLDGNFYNLNTDYSDIKLLNSKGSAFVDNSDLSIKGGVSFSNPGLSLDANAYNQMNHPGEGFPFPQLYGQDIPNPDKHPICATQDGTLVRCPNN